MKDNAVDFSYLNDQKGRAVIIPQVKSLPAFMEQARRMRWIDSLLDHIAGPGYDKDDAAEWLFYFLGKKNDAASTLALEALGLPLVNWLDDASAQAMWSESQKNAFIGVEMPL